MRNETLMQGAMMLAALTFAGCAAENDPDSPGSCKLTCSGMRTAASDYLVEAHLMPAEKASYSCDMGDTGPDNEAIGALSSPIQVRYRVFQVRTAAGGGEEEGEGGDDEAASGLIGVHPNFDVLQEKTPVQGVGFEPSMAGVMATWKTHPDAASVGQFAGVETPPSEWCSDSCGIMTFEFRPACAEGMTNEVSVGIAVGAAPVPERFALTVGE